VELIWKLILTNRSTGLPEDLEQTEAWIKNCHERENCWNLTIELLPTAEEEAPTGTRIIGLIGAVRAPEVGYMLNTNYWGKGFATEALQAFLPLFFAHYSGGEQGRFEFAEARTDSELVSSQRVLLKCGFVFERLFEKDFENRTLGIRDTMLFRKYRPEALEMLETN
jgi:RimJ/RimL family protein N-acetyltransferase